MNEATKWLESAIDEGIEEWIQTRASVQIPAPNDGELTIYRMAFAAGADAALQHVSRVLAREE